MNRISLILKNKISASLFIIAAVIGAILIAWYLNSIKQNDINSEVLEEKSITEDVQRTVEEIIEDHEVPSDSLSSLIPSGMKAVNLPISFFGDQSILKIGDSIDIISTYYDKESAMIHAEIILGSKEIINIKSGHEAYEGSNEVIDSSIFPEISFGTDVDIGINNTLVITFFLKDEEIVRSFIAIESGMLYLSLCSENNTNTNY